MSLAAPDAGQPFSVPFRVIDHPSDTGFEVTGSSLTELFTNAALVLSQLIWNLETNRDGERLEEEINVTAGDPGELMVNFLQEILYLSDAKGMVCTGVRLTAISESALTATVWGHRYEAGMDEELLGVKAVTYHQLFVGPENGRWRARVLLDI
jgi:SHS2 domain-containing protein